MTISKQIILSNGCGKNQILNGTETCPDRKIPGGFLGHRSKNIYKLRVFSSLGIDFDIFKVIQIIDSLLAPF